MDGSPRRAIALPRPPEVAAQHRFPVIATLAPLVASVVLFAVTRSAFTLAFAALGPVVAVASVADARIVRARTRRRETARFAAEVEAVIVTMAAAHDAERLERTAVSPGAASLVASREAVAARWRRPSAGQLSLRVGSGEVASDLVIGGSESLDADATVADLRSRAGRLHRAPVSLLISSGLISSGLASSGIGIAGSPTLCAAVARGLAIQLAASLSPAVWSVTGGPDWMNELPHRRGEADRDDILAFRSESGSVSIAFAAFATELPPGLDAYLELAPNGTAQVINGRAQSTAQTPAQTPMPTTAQIDFVGVEQAVGLASQLARLADEIGLRAPTHRELPAQVEFGPLTQHGDDSTLASAVGVAAEGPLLLDLVGQGPHAVVGGTTGSGKSELLLSWVLGMAASRSPSVVTFLFVDFKGGASFGLLTELPHSVGVLTDLDASGSRRALASLAAEVRFRERDLASRSLRSIDEVTPPPFPRLVVVVDEYAAVVDAFPDLHAAFADIAARGRSLGVHLILCTQRPAGVVRDGILANCALRVSLRVTSAADSVAVVGTEAAAALPARPPGRAVAGAVGEPPAPFQVAKSTAEDVHRIRQRWASSAPPRQPWLPPLPRLLPLAELEPGELHPDLPFGIADLPDEQAQRMVAYSPREVGSLLVLGAPRSGKSGVLTTLGAAPTILDLVRVAGEVAAAWDALAAALSAPAARERVLLFDDIDSLIAGCPEGYQDAFVDLLARVLREGPAVGTHCVLTAQRASGVLHSLAALCGSRLVLRMPDRADHALAGAGDGFDAQLPPGGGFWQGNRIQVAWAEPVSLAPVAPNARELDPALAVFAAVSTRPEALAERLGELAPSRRVVLLAPVAFGAPREQLDVSRGGAPAIVVADPDAWQSQWSVFAALQRSGDILFDGCSLADIRALTQARELPPPFPRGERPLWIRSIDGEVRRARLVVGSVS